jgi:hypothetical protein
MASRFHVIPSCAFGRIDPLNTLSKLTTLYKCLADSAEPSSQKRAENTILRMVELRITPEFLNRLPLGILSPIREAARTCQLAPPSDWPLEAYRVVGRNDVAASASQAPDLLFGDGYKAVKDFIVSDFDISRFFLTLALRIHLAPVRPSGISPLKLKSLALGRCRRSRVLNSTSTISQIYGSDKIAGWKRLRGCCVLRTLGQLGLWSDRN